MGQVLHAFQPLRVIENEVSGISEVTWL